MLKDNTIDNELNRPNPKIIEARINKEKLGIIIFDGTNLSAIHPIEIAVIGLIY